jgi:hypothetical protein
MPWWNIISLNTSQIGKFEIGNCKEREMDVLWIVNTNTFLLVILVIMISYLTMQVNAVIRFLRRE